jgi:hypothetical protein
MTDKKKAGGYGPNHRAAMAGAELQFRRLGCQQKRALTRAPTARGVPYVAAWVASTTAKRVWASLVRRGLLTEEGWLTPMGLLVREAGLALEARRG